MSLLRFAKICSRFLSLMNLFPHIQNSEYCSFSAPPVDVCYVPPRKIMELRELVRYRANLIRMRSGVKNRIHASPKSRFV